jgi:hypothetical protein
MLGTSHNISAHIRQEQHPLRQPPPQVFAALDALFAEYIEINQLDATSGKTLSDFIHQLEIAVGVWAVS